MECCNLWTRLRVSFMLLCSILCPVVSLGCYPTDYQITPFEVRVSWIALMVMISVLSQIKLDGSAT